MKLKVVYQRPHASDIDMMVTIEPTATVADLAAELLATDPEAPGTGPEQPTLSVRSPSGGAEVVLDSVAPLGESPIASGYSVRIVPTPRVGRGGGTRTSDVPAAPLVSLAVVSGPESGLRQSFVRGSFFLGRGASNDVVLSDPLVSNLHARLQVGATVELIDLNSANGLALDGGLVPRVTVVDGLEVTLGDSVVRFSMIRDQEPRVLVAAAIPFDRSPRVEERYPGRELPHPDVPNEQDPAVFPWMLMLVPVLMGSAMFAYTGRAITLLFIAMAPLMMMGNYWMTRQRTRRTARQEIGRFEAQVAELEQILAAEQPREQRVRSAEFPATARMVDAAMRRDSLLWTRRPEHWNYLHLRLGTGPASSRVTMAASRTGSRGLPEYAARVDELRDRYALVPEVPIVEDLRSAGALGVVGVERHDVVRALLAQVTALHSPDEVVLTALLDPGTLAEYDWLKWLPHATSTRSPIPGPHLVDSAASGEALVATIEQLVDERLKVRGSSQVERPEEYRPPLEDEVRAMSAGSRVGEEDESRRFPRLPVVIVLISDDCPVERGRLVQLLERAPAADVFPIVSAETLELLPAACRTYVERDGGASDIGFVRHGTTCRGVRTEELSRSDAMRFARALSGVVDAGAHVVDVTDLPAHVTLLDLVGGEMAGRRGAAVLDRWRQNGSLPGNPPPAGRRRPSLRALVGQTSTHAMALDLRAHGPHALVGGTTGAGKSEFLQSWVLGLAAEHSPARVSFLFVDYKGGAAFADCLGLPHQVGLVTDLSPHLVVRALSSLRAELRHRERVLGEKKAKDLTELERRGDPDCPPALVIVIDEFAALVGEVPEFVDGVVDVAQRGRSLGLHLVMATQRPAGVIRDNLRANTNLRIALRMADESDSVDVIGIPDAAAFDPHVPGRAVAKTGPGRVVPFQSAYAGGWSEEESDQPSSVVEELRVGASVVWRRPDVESAEALDRGPTDQQRLVSAISAASSAAGLAAPRRPWLPELARTYELAELLTGSDEHLALGMADLPDQQSQQVACFLPDVDGHLAVYGTGGSGKTGVLRALAVAAGRTGAGGPVEVFGIDMGSGGLRALEPLPHVGAVIPGDDRERVVRLMRRLRSEVERRSQAYVAASASTIGDFRRHAARPQEPRVLLLVDGFPAFRDEYESTSRESPYATLQELLSVGRPLGLHVVVTADRPASIPGAVAATMPRRVVLRMADDTMYTVLDTPQGVLGQASPPGRAVVDRTELQVGVLGNSPSAVDQVAAIERMAAELTAAGVRRAEPVQTMPREFSQDTLPDSVDGRPALGVEEASLLPTWFDPSGALLVGGGPGSGRSSALLALAVAMERHDPDGMRVYLGARSSALAAWQGWDEVADSLEAAGDLVRKLTEELEGWSPAERRLCVVVEAVSDFQGTTVDPVLGALVKAIRRTGHLLIAESETSTWAASSYSVFGEVKASRHGLLLQPDHLEGEHILKTPFPRAARREFPPGRGYYVSRGVVRRVQLPLP